MTTKALAVKQALHGILSGMPIVASDRVQVTYGFPTRSPDRRWAVVGEINWDGAQWATNRSRQEEFRVQVVFDAQIAGTAEDAESCVLAMADAFGAALAADPSLGGLCVTSGYTPRVLKCWPIDGAYEAQFETEVRVTCRP